MVEPSHSPGSAHLQTFGHPRAQKLDKMLQSNFGRRATDAVRVVPDGRMTNLWRAGDAEGDVLGVLVQTRRNTWAALKLMRKFKKKYWFAPDNLVTDDL